MATYTVNDLTADFGSEILGLDPEAALADPDVRAELQSLFDRRGVLVFRDLDVDEVTHANLIRMLIGMGPLAEGESPNGRPDGSTFYVSNKEERGGAPYGRLLFHADMMWSEHTFQVLSLYAVEVEPGVAPTLFASSAHAWDTLPDHLRASVTDRNAIQGHAEHERERAGDDPDVLVTTFENLQTRTTPVGFDHPRTGDTLLYVSEQMTERIEDLPHDESEALLSQLFEHLYRPEGLYEHQWRTHDLVAWDNIAMQHGRPNVTLEGPARTLRKLFAPIPPRTATPARPTFSTTG